ncbi:unnamed protein product, partial [Ectocarpus fasciculatus]
AAASLRRTAPSGSAWRSTSWSTAGRGGGTPCSRSPSCRPSCRGPAGTSLGRRRRPGRPARTAWAWPRSSGGRTSTPTARRLWGSCSRSSGRRRLALTTTTARTTTTVGTRVRLRTTRCRPRFGSWSTARAR